MSHQEPGDFHPERAPAPARCELCGALRYCDHAPPSRERLYEIVDWLAELSREDEDELRRLIRWFADVDRLDSQALKIILAKMLQPATSVRMLAQATGIKRSTLVKILQRVTRECPRVRELFRAGWRAAEAQRRRRAREKQERDAAGTPPVKVLPEGESAKQVRKSAVFPAPKAALRCS